MRGRRARRVPVERAPLCVKPLYDLEVAGRHRYDTRRVVPRHGTPHLFRESPGLHQDTQHHQLFHRV